MDDHLVGGFHRRQMLALAHHPTPRRRRHDVRHLSLDHNVGVLLEVVFVVDGARGNRVGVVRAERFAGDVVAVGAVGHTGENLDVRRDACQELSARRSDESELARHGLGRECAAVPVGVARSPATEAMLTIAPSRAARSGSRAAWHMRNVPVRFTAIVRFQSSRESVRVDAIAPTPAMLARTWSAPNASSAPATVAATDAGSATSHATALETPPAFTIDWAVPDAAAASTSAHTTVAPSVANRSAVARRCHHPRP